MTIYEMTTVNTVKKLVSAEIGRLSRIISNRPSSRLISWALKQRMKFEEILVWLSKLG